ncbi:ACP5 [Symbiodinium natans]|uniref:ACP5 protein n=1 Tax=Symbiodinium natans TaxID=878477 RepID=A0A812HME3_9DINO|nr:ACP5 [Symbiodinium natans]
MQESDLMDQLPDGQSRGDAETEQIMLVSLGCFCGPKLSFKNIGRGAETLPFDWMRTRHEGLVHFLRNDWGKRSNWNGFFDFNSKKVVPGCNMTTYRSYYHSFWHDDPTDPGMHERYLRRINRFNKIDAKSRPVLFVRTIPTTEELKDVPELLNLLRKRHGEQAYLLLIIDFQKTADGPAVVEGMDNIMVHYMAGSKHVNQEGLPAPPYGEAVNLALDWIVGRPVGVMQFDSWDTIMKCADRTDWGLNGLGGLYAFEPSLEAPEEEPFESMPDPLPQLPAERSQFLIEDYAVKALEGDRLGLENLKVVSLGSTGLVKASLLSLALNTPELPFDWLQISDAGVLHFLRKGWEAPTREGLGAGGQRPSEKHGFFDYTTRRRVPGTSLMMCRSHVHSFWHDDPAIPEVRQKFTKLFQQFDELTDEPDVLKLFVRAVATSSELGRARDLMQAITKKFGKQAALLLICDFQSQVRGPHMVDPFEDLMVYFLEGDAHKEAIPYKKPIIAALDWIAGRELQISVAPDLKALEALAQPTSWGLRGLGGFHAFEMLTASADEWLPGPEEQWLVDAKFEADKESLALVSLGYHEKLGQALHEFNAEASPFDGCFVSGEGVLHFLRSDFCDFLEVPKAEKVPGTDFFVRRSCYHSFWDHDGESALNSAKEGLRSFRELLQTTRTKLFVRAAANADELLLIGELYGELTKRFGRALLLVLLSGQATRTTFTLQDNYNILVQFFEEEEDAQTGSMRCYTENVKKCLDWAVGKPSKVGVVPDLAALRGLVTAPNPPISGPGGALPEVCALFKEDLHLASTTDESPESSMSNSSSPAKITASVDNGPSC